MKLSESADTLVVGFGKVKKSYDKMRGWKRALTVYCQRRSQETGKPEYRFRAAIKMLLTKAGYDVAQI